MSVCGEVLRLDPENVNVLKDRAEAYVQEEDYEAGKPAPCSLVLLTSVYLSLGVFKRPHCETRIKLIAFEPSNLQFIHFS